MLATLQGEPLKSSSAPGVVTVSKTKTNSLCLQKKQTPYPAPNTHPSLLWLLR